MDLPYRSYELVAADGSAVERADKHAFCMARVHYSANEDAADVWFQPVGGGTTYRWQQSASEIRVLIELKDHRSGDLDVSFTSRTLHVAFGDVVVLAGIFEHRIIPAECVWDFNADEGMVSLFISKANTALYASPGNHSVTEWKRLFASDNYEVKWDDSSKHYGDLPEVSMKAFEKEEAIKNQARLLDFTDVSLREKSVEADELRRRARVARLAVLRGVK